MSEWYRQEGAESDVVLATRARLSRNLTGHLFPGTMGIDEEIDVTNKLDEAFIKAAGEGYILRSLGSMSPGERRILLEEKLITQDFCINKEKHFIISADRNFSGLINGEDHLRMIRYQGGLALHDVLSNLLDLDRKLESVIDFNANFEYGYIGPDLNNLGTGLKMSILLHLPSLQITGLIDKTVKTVLQSGLQVEGFSGEEEQSLGQYYIISNRNTLGVNEEEIRDELENMAGQLLTYERMAREDLMKRKKIELEDRVYRGEGLLEYSRLLSRNEGIELTATLRLGKVLGFNDYDLDRINSLLVLGQDSHIKEKLQKNNEKTDPQNVERARADFFRMFLNTKETREGVA